MSMIKLYNLDGHAFWIFMDGRIKKSLDLPFLIGMDRWISSVNAEKAVGCNKLKLHETKILCFENIHHGVI